MMRKTESTLQLQMICRHLALGYMYCQMQYCMTEGYCKLWRVMAKAGRIMNVQNNWKNPMFKIYTSKGSQTSMMWSLEHQIRLCTDTTVCTDYGHYIFEC